ncbi:uncharacterized protein LOC114181072 [Vigna unguiculata]|uniref:uncharacterized protein LOC114181072 n=1 Tax=Vigna unguiculata TaxID=3917 RepID=UPI0010168326|nr:uncharacterized protein LOC114181072 [Vigna unguiculata]
MLHLLSPSRTLSSLSLPLSLPPPSSVAATTLLRPPSRRRLRWCCTSISCIAILCTAISCTSFSIFPTTVIPLFLQDIWMNIIVHQRMKHLLRDPPEEPLG